MPASISLEIISSLSLAGPSVHTILVFLIILFSSLNGRHSQTARHTPLFLQTYLFYMESSALSTSAPAPSSSYFLHEKAGRIRIFKPYKTAAHLLFKVSNS